MTCDYVVGREQVARREQRRAYCRSVDLKANRLIIDTDAQSTHLTNGLMACCTDHELYVAPYKHELSGESGCQVDVQF